MKNQETRDAYVFQFFRFHYRLLSYKISPVTIQDGIMITNTYSVDIATPLIFQKYIVFARAVTQNGTGKGVVTSAKFRSKEGGRYVFHSYHIYIEQLLLKLFNPFILFTFNVI